MKFTSESSDAMSEKGKNLFESHNNKEKIGNLSNDDDVKNENVGNFNNDVPDANDTDTDKIKNIARKQNDKKDLGLSSNQKEEIGFKAKAVLDWGRVLFLREVGFKATLCYYVDKTVSPENVCLVATKLK